MDPKRMRTSKWGIKLEPITPEVAKKKLKHRVRQNKTARLRKCSSWDIATTVKDNGIYERHDQIRKKLIDLDHRMEITESSILQNYKELKEEVDRCKLDIVKYGVEGGSIREYSEEAQEIIKLENRLTMAEEIFKTNFDKIESRVEEDNAKLMSDRQELIEERERLMEISYDLAILQESMNTHSEDINFVKSVSIDLRTADSVLSENLDEIQEIIGKVDEEIKYIKGIQTETEEKYAQVIITEDMSNNAINELREEIRRCQGEIRQLRENQNVIVDELSTDINAISEEVKDEVNKISDEVKEKLGEEKAEVIASFDAILNDVKVLKENQEIFTGKHESELEKINGHLFEVEENLSNESNVIKLLKQKQLTLVEKNEVKEIMKQLNTQHSEGLAKINNDIALIKESFAEKHEVESELENINNHIFEVEENLSNENNEIKLLKEKQLTLIEKNEVKELISQLDTQNSEDFAKVNEDIALMKETFAGRHEVESELENISKHFVQVEESIFNENNEIKLLKEKQQTFIERSEVKEMVTELNTQNSDDFTKIDDEIALIKETFAGRHEVESELENITKQFKKVEDMIFNENNEIKLLKEKQSTLIEKEEVDEIIEQLKHEQNTDLTKIKNDLKEEKEEIDNIKQNHENFIENTEMRMNLMNTHFMQLEEIIYNDNNEIELLKEKQSTLIEMSDVHDLFTQLKTEQEQLSDVIEKVRDDSNVDKDELEKTIRDNHDQFLEQMSQQQVALSEEFGKLENKIKTEKKEIEDIRENFSYFAGKREVTGEINNLNEHFKRLNESLNLQIETVQTMEDKQTSFVEKNDLNKLIDDLNNEKLTLADIISKLTEGFEEDREEITSLKKNQELYPIKIDTDSEMNSINEKISQIEKTVFDEKDRINSLKNKQDDMIEKHEVIELINKIITNQEKDQGDIKSVQERHSDLVNHVSIELNALNDHIGVLEENLYDENMKIKDIIESETRFAKKEEISVEIKLLNDILNELGNDVISHLDEMKNKMATTEDVGKIVDDFCIIDELLISHLEQIKNDVEKGKGNINEWKNILLTIEELKNSKVDTDDFKEYKEKNSSKRKNLIKLIDEMNTENEWFSESISKLEEDQEISKEDIETLKDHQLKLTETNEFLTSDIDAERIELEQYKELLDQLIESNNLYNDQHQLIKTIFKSVEEQLMTHLNLLDKRVGKLETSKNDDAEMFNMITDQQNELSTLVNQLGTVDCFTDTDYNELQTCLTDLHSNIDKLHERETLRDDNEAANEFTDKVNTLGSIMDQLKISLQNNNASGKEGDLKALLSHLAMSKVEEIVKQIKMDVQTRLGGNGKDEEGDKTNEKIDLSGRMNSFIELKVSETSGAEIPLDELDLKVKKELMKLPDQDLSDETETLLDDDETIPEDVETLPEDVETLPEDVETLPDTNEIIPNDDETVPQQIAEVVVLPGKDKAISCDGETIPNDDHSTLDDDDNVATDVKIVSEDEKRISDVIDEDDDGDYDDDNDDNDDNEESDDGVRSEVKTNDNNEVIIDGPISDQIKADVDITQTKADGGNKLGSNEFPHVFKEVLTDKSEKSTDSKSSLNENEIKTERKRSLNIIKDVVVQAEYLPDQNEEEKPKGLVEIQDASLFKENEDLGDENILALEEDLQDLKKSLTLFEKTFENMSDFKEVVKEKEDKTLSDKANIQNVNDSFQILKKDLLAFKEDIDNQSKGFEAKDENSIQMNKEVTKERKDGDLATQMRKTSSVKQIKSPVKHSKMNKEHEEDEKDVDTSYEEERTTATTKATKVSPACAFEEKRKNEELAKKIEKNGDEAEIAKGSASITAKDDVNIENTEVKSQTKIKEIVSKENKSKKEKPSLKNVDNQTKSTTRAKTKNIRSKTSTSTGLKTVSQKPQKISASKDQSKTSSKGKANQEQLKLATKSQKVKEEKAETKGADKLSVVNVPSKKQGISNKTISSTRKKSQTATHNPISDEKVKNLKKKKVPDVIKNDAGKHEYSNQNKTDLKMENTVIETLPENISGEKDSLVYLPKKKVEMEGKLLPDENNESKVKVFSESVDIKQVTVDKGRNLSKNEINENKIKIEDAEFKTEMVEETISESKEMENTIHSGTDTRKKESTQKIFLETKIGTSNINEIPNKNINDEFDSKTSFVSEGSFLNQTNTLQYDNIDLSQTHSNDNHNLLTLVNTLITNASTHTENSDNVNESTNKHYSTLIHELQLLAKAAEDGDENAIRDLNLGNLASTNSCTPMPSFIQTNIKNEYSNTSNINLVGPLPESIEMPPPGVMSSADHIMEMRADRVTKHIVGDLIDRLSEAENFTRKNVSKLGEVVAKQSEAIQLLNERQDEVTNKNTALDLVDQLITDGERIRESFRKLKEDVERDNAEIRRIGQDNLAALEDKFDAAHQSLSENFEMLQNVVAQFGEEMSFIRDINFEGSFDAITSEILSIRDEIGQNQDNIFSVQDEQIRLAALTEDFMESEGVLRKNYAEMQAVVASVYEEFERAKNAREVDTSSESGTDLNIIRYLQAVDDLKSEQGKMDSKMEEMKNRIEEKNKEDVQLMREELEKQTEENTKATLESLKMEMNKEAERREELLQEKINEENEITRENIIQLKEELGRNANELIKQSEEHLQEKMVSLKGEIDAETKERENSMKGELLKQNQENTAESISVLKEELTKDAKEMGETFKEEIAKQKEQLDKEIEEREHSMKEELANQREELDKDAKERNTLMKEELVKQKEELNQEALDRDILMKEELDKQKEEIEQANERFDTLKEELGKQNEARDKETKECIEENASRFKDEFAKHREKVSSDAEMMKAVQANLIDQFMSAKTHLKDDFVKIQNLVGKVDKELEVLKELKKKEKQQQAIDSETLGEMKEDIGNYKSTTDNEIKALKDKQDKLMILKDQFRIAEESLQSDFDNIQGLVMNVDEELEELKEKNKKKANLETVVVLAERLTVTEEYTCERLEELRQSIERDNKEISLLKAKQEAMTDKEELMKLVEKVDSLEQLLTDNYERLREEVNTSNEKMKLLVEKEEERNINETIKKLAERLSLTEELLRENFEKITSGLGMNLTEIRELKRHQDIEEYVVITLSGRLTVLEEAFNDSVPQLKKELHKEGRIIDVLMNKHNDGEHAIDELRAKRSEDQVIIEELKTKQVEAEEVMKKLLERQDATEKELQKTDNQMTVAEINLKSDITELDEKVVKAIEKMDQTMVESYDQNIADTKTEFNQRLDQAIEKIDQVVVDTNSKIDEKFNLTDNKLSEFIINQLTPLLDETTKQTNTMEVVKSKLNEYVHCDELTALTKRVHNYETSTVDALTQLNEKINNENNENQSIKDTVTKEAEKRKEIEDHIENIENILFLDEASDTDNSKLQWVLSHYKHHFTKGKPVYSPIFFTQLNGYRFQLGINWLGEKKGSLGIYLYLHKGKFEGKDIPPFTVPYTLGLQNKKTDNRSTKVAFLTESSKDREVSNKRQKKEKGSRERKYVELREGSEPLPSIELIDDVTMPYKPYLLPMPSLDDYVVNDTLTVFCTFKPQQQE